MSDTAPESVSPSVDTAIAEFVASLPPLPAEQGGLGSPPPADPPPSQASASPSATPEPEKPEDPKFARGFQRLAQKEQALVAREQALTAKEQEIAKSSQSTLATKFKQNPLRTLRELGLDNDQISQFGRAALGATLEGAPQPYRDLADKLRFDDQNEDIKSELAKLKDEIRAEKEQVQRERTNADYRAAYHSELTKYVATPELSTEAPTVARLHAVEPEETMRRIYDVVARDAQAKLRSGGGEPLSPQQAAKVLEQELAPFAKAFGGTPSAATQTARVPDATARKTLSDSAVNPAPTSRTAPDPETDWEGWKKAQEAAWLADLHRKG